MTRRHIVLPIDKGFLMSQEFNGDRTESVRFHGANQPIRANWPTVVALFLGCETEQEFLTAVKQAETWYGYEPIAPERADVLPSCEELWICDSGRLTLVARYGEPVDEAADDIYRNLNDTIAASLHKDSDGRVFQMLDGLSRLPIPYKMGEGNYAKRDLDNMQVGDFSQVIPAFADTNPSTEIVRLK